MRELVELEQGNLTALVTVDVVVVLEVREADTRAAGECPGKLGLVRPCSIERIQLARFVPQPAFVRDLRVGSAEDDRAERAILEGVSDWLKTD